MRKSLLFPGLLACAAFAVSSFAADPPPAAPKIGQAPPAFTLNDTSGKAVSLSDFKGKIVVLEWINYQCPIDRRVIDSKYISTVYNKYKDKVVWMAIDSAAAHTQDDYAKTIDQCKLAYPLLVDPKGTVGHLYNATNTPQLFIITADGKLAYNGAIDNDPDGSKPDRVNYVDQALAEILAGKPVSLAESKPYGCTVKY